jgi:hypothetical protein
VTETLSHHEQLAPPIRPVGKRVLSIAAHVVLAVTLLVIAPLAVFLPAVLFHCAVRNGRRAAWIVFIVSAAVVLLLVLPGAQDAHTPANLANMSIAFTVGLLLAVGLPSVLALPLIEHGERFGRVLVFAVLAALGGLLATEVIMQLAASFSPYAAQLAAAHEFMGKALQFYARNGMQADSISALRKMMNLLAYAMPGVILSDVAIVFVLSLVLFVRLPAWRQFAERRALPAPRAYLFRNLALPDWLLFAFVVGGVSPLLTGLPQRIGASVLAVVAFLYILQGLAIFRAYVAAASAGFALFAWGALILLTPFSLGLLGIAGLFDSFFDFRHFNRKDSSDESHSH